MNSGILIGALIVLALIFMFSLAQNKMEMFANLILRSLLTILSIYFINKGLHYFQIESGVQINLLTVCTGGLLGIPGIVLCYAAGVYFSL